MSTIEKAIGQLASGVEVGENEVATDITIPDANVTMEDQVEVTELPDGGAEINTDLSETIDQTNIPFDANLADYLSDTQLREISSSCVASYESDFDSRKDWHDTYVKGLDMLGFKYEDRSQPFEGASGVVHPLLSESVTQFQAQAYKELLPPGGPVNTEIVGEITPQVEEQAKRVKDYMNYEITHVMKEYDPDMDQLLFYLPLAGSAFKKVYYDSLLQRAVSKFVAGEDCVVNYMASSLEDAQRITHVIKTSSNDLRKQQVQGFYRDVELSSGSVSTINDIKEKVNELEGLQNTLSEDDNEHVLLEMHVEASPRS